MGKKRALTGKQVAYVRRNLTPHNLYDLADELNVSDMTIRSAVKGEKHYAEVDCGVDPIAWVRQQRTRGGKIGTTKRDEIRALHKQGVLNQDIAKKYGISESYVSRILAGHYD